MEENKELVSTEEETSTEIESEQKTVGNISEEEKNEFEEEVKQEPVVEKKPVKKEKFKALKIIWKVFKTILTIFLLLIVLVIVVQRVSNNKAAIAGYGVYTVVSESMVPEYNIYDMLLAKKVDPSVIRIGDDVVYQGKEGDFVDKIVTHRVIKQRYDGNSYYFTTKGIANDIEDPEISQDQLYGKVMLKSEILSSISKVVNTSYGFYFIIFMPIVIIVTLEVIDTVNERKRLKREQE